MFSTVLDEVLSLQSPSRVIFLSVEAGSDPTLQQEYDLILLIGVTAFKSLPTSSFLGGCAVVPGLIASPFQVYFMPSLFFTVYIHSSRFLCITTLSQVNFK